MTLWCGRAPDMCGRSRGLAWVSHTAVKGAPVKFHVNRDVFSEAVSFVVKLLPQRNPQPILDGEIDEFIKSYLRWSIGKETSTT